LAPLDHRVDDARVAAQWGGQREYHTFVSASGLCDQPRQVFRHMSARREHEWVCDDRGRSLLDATGNPLGDRRLCDLHVRPLHDAFGAESLLDESGDFIEQRVGSSVPAAVVD
jgi:hypothetical protein